VKGTALPAGPVTAAADHAVVETLLRCWVREHGITVGGGEVSLEVRAGTITVPVTVASATGWHRFGSPTLDGATVGPEGLVAVLADDLHARHQLGPERRRDLVARTLSSRDRIVDHAAARAGASPPMPLTFLDGEQELIAGHPFHPAAKSREDLDATELLAYSPELRGSFRLRWFAVDRAGQ
jgi:siderophore synthetase component